MKTGLILEGGAMRGLFTAGVMDVEYMAQGIRVFYETEIACTADGDYTLSHRA